MSTPLPAQPRPPLLVIRADANSQIGSGHLMRCLAFAEHWQHLGGNALFIIHQPPFTIQNRLQETGFTVSPLRAIPGTTNDARESAKIAQNSHAAWIMLDGYQFSPDYQRILKNSSIPLLILDDFGQIRQYHTDVVLDQNLAAHPLSYQKRSPTTKLLLGNRFVLLRREFLNRQNRDRTIPNPARHLLITLGGADHANYSAQLLELLAQTGPYDLTITLVVGPNNPHLDDLQKRAARTTLPIQIVHDTRHMPQLMAEADLAVAAGGTTAWEIAFMGLPSLLLTLADNQIPNALALHQHGAARSIGPPATETFRQLATEITALTNDPAARAQMSECARALVDGLGPHRLWRHLNCDSIRLRPAQPQDCRTIWEWANDRAVRAVSFFPDLIPWTTHVQWFQSHLANPQSLLWIASNPTGQLLGQVRFDLQDKEALISTSLDPAQRGRHYGNLLIWTASRALFQHKPQIERIQAWIKLGNEPSKRAFEKAGFTRAGQVTVRSQPAWLFTATRQNLFDEL